MHEVKEKGGGSRAIWPFDALPDITFDIDLSPHRLDIQSERVNVSLLIGGLTKEALIARRIGTLEMRLFASPAYLQARGHPQHPP